LRIAQFQIVVVFDVDESIVLSCGPHLKELKKNLGGRLLHINVPDGAPPPLPRAVLKSKDTILKLGLDRFDITSVPPSHITDDMAKAAHFARERSTSIISMLEPAMPDYKWSGIISVVEYPEEPVVSNSGLEIATPIFDRLLNVDRKERELGSFQLQFGFQEDHYFINYTLDTFEQRKIEVPLSAQEGFIAIDVKDYPLTACGAKLTIDINNKVKRSKESPVTDINMILEKQLEVFENVLSDLNLEGVIR